MMVVVAQAPLCVLQVASTLPFNIRSHPAAATEVAQDMLQRMEGDMGTFANMVNQARVPVLRSVGARRVCFDGCGIFRMWCYL